jgi:hypothetical protein
MIREMHIDQTWLNNRIAITKIDLKDLLHACERNHHPTAHGKAAAREARPCPARDKRNVEFVAQSDNGHDLLGRNWKNHDVGASFFYDETVTFINQKLLRLAKHALVTHNRTQTIEHSP